MALQAYPDVPLFRYPYTDLSEAQIAAALAAPAQVGPGSKGPLDNNLAGKVLNFAWRRRRTRSRGPSAPATG